MTGVSPVLSSHYCARGSPQCCSLASRTLALTVCSVQALESARTVADNTNVSLSNNEIEEI